MVNIAYNNLSVKVKPLVCVPIAVDNHKKALKLANLALKKANLIEIWLDKLNFKGIEWILKHCSGHKVIAVCRKGKNKAEKLLLASKLGANFVDIDINEGVFEIQKFKKQKRKNTKLIISYHNFKNTPSLDFLIKQTKNMFALGADIVKIATFIKNQHENTILFELLLKFKKSGKRQIAVGMGEKGRLSRIACLYLGSFLTYAALNEKMKTAEGQLILKDFK